MDFTFLGKVYNSKGKDKSLRSIGMFRSLAPIKVQEEITVYVQVG